MDSTNRIQQISTTQTTARQTPNNDFGTVMARTLGEAVRSGAGVIGGLAGGGGVLSTAVSGVQRAVGIVSTGSTAAVGTSAYAASGVAPVGGPSTSLGAAGRAPTTGRGESWDLLEAQRLLQSDNQSFNMQYLQLQNAMQAESREHNAISNIMKVRHDSAKAAINNIR